MVLKHFLRLLTKPLIDYLNNQFDENRLLLGKILSNNNKNLSIVKNIQDAEFGISSQRFYRYQS